MLRYNGIIKGDIRQLHESEGKSVLNRPLTSTRTVVEFYGFDYHRDSKKIGDKYMAVLFIRP